MCVPGRRQRADARRSRAAVLDAAVVLLGRRPEASLDEIAAAAGVSRQTLYAHFPSRQALLTAVTDRVTAEVAAALGELDVDRGDPVAALSRWLHAAWRLITRYPVLLTPAITAANDLDDRARHEPVTGGLMRLIGRGRAGGDFDSDPPIEWLLAATIGLGHAAGQEVAAGRIDADVAGTLFHDAVLAICRRRPPIDRRR